VAWDRVREIVKKRKRKSEKEREREATKDTEMRRKKARNIQRKDLQNNTTREQKRTIQYNIRQETEKRRWGRRGRGD
jgi:hypothetical protein